MVFHTSPGDIDTVLIAGKIMKRDGKLVGVDYNAARREAEASRDWIIDAVMETKGELLPPEESLSLVNIEATAVANMSL